MSLTFFIFSSRGILISLEIIEDSIYISCEAYEKIYKNNIELRNKLAKLEKIEAPEELDEEQE